MNCFRYKIEHDFGFAPNPFHGTLSLATCKGDILYTKILQKSGIQKNEVIELIYRGFI